jgi:hypothetical protein
LVGQNRLSSATTNTATTIDATTRNALSPLLSIVSRPQDTLVFAQSALTPTAIRNPAEECIDIRNSIFQTANHLAIIKSKNSARGC